MEQVASRSSSGSGTCARVGRKSDPRHQYGTNSAPAHRRATYLARTVRRRTGSVTAEIVEYKSGGVVVNLDCAVTSWSPERNRIKLTFWRDRLAESGALITRLMFGNGNGNGNEGDLADFTKTVRVGQS